MGLSRAAFAEDAEQQAAIAREGLLNEYRKNFREVKRLVAAGESARREAPCTTEDMEGLQWVDALAQAGHVGALGLRGRVFAARNRLDELLAVAPDALREMAQHAPPLARFLVQEECRSPQPDVNTALRWLDAGIETDRQMAAGVRELLAVAAGMAPPDWKILGTFLHAFEIENRVYRDGEWVKLPADLVWSFAKYRLASDDATKHPAGASLARRAATLGSTRARRALWPALYEAAVDKRACLEDWFARYPGHFEEAVKPCLELGAALEHGDSRTAPDFDAAMAWYQRATEIDARHAFKPQQLLPDFCHWVAHAFDRRWKRCIVADDVLAIRWHERGFAVGDERCLDAWLIACANREMGVRADPALAEEQVRRYCSSGVALKPRKWRISAGVRATVARADRLLAEGDAETAARWLVVGTLLEHDEPQFRLGTLALQGRGVKQDEAVARSLFEKAAAQGHAGAKQALAAMQDGR